MRREIRCERENLVEKLEQLGLTFHTLDGQPYWNEAASYLFTREEVETLENATNELHSVCLAAVEHIIKENELSSLGIPEVAHQVIRQAWEDDPPAIYGRFDLSFDGGAPPKLLEYNADTPTSLLEAAVVQWHWLQEVEPNADQFNSIWEGLVEKWTELRNEGSLKSNLIHFACMESAEDLMTTVVLMDTAKESGLDVELLSMPEIGWASDSGRFVDLKDRPIDTIFKLYPWEWLISERFGSHALSSYERTQWIEPIWKMVLSNKAILSVLWELFPNHPNLLPSFLDGPREMKSYVSKPILGREGANVSLVSADLEVQSKGPFARDPVVFQEYAPLPVFAGNHAVIGSWVIDGVSRGIGVRESNGPITEDHARFVPHYFT